MTFNLFNRSIQYHRIFGSYTINLPSGTNFWRGILICNFRSKCDEGKYPSFLLYRREQNPFQRWSKIFPCCEPQYFHIPLGAILYLFHVGSFISGSGGSFYYTTFIVCNQPFSATGSLTVTSTVHQLLTVSARGFKNPFPGDPLLGLPPFWGCIVSVGPPKSVTVCVVGI